MGTQPVHDLHRLSQLILTRNPFLVRRTLIRLEARELTLSRAIQLLSGRPNLTQYVHTENIIRYSNKS